MTRFLACLAVVLALASPATATAADGESFQPVGLWRLYDTDGTVFHARLYADQTATTDLGESGERGIWRRETLPGGVVGVRIYYTDGWDDLLLADGEGFSKRSWDSHSDRCGPPSNETAAEYLGDDPTADLPG